MRCYIIIFRVFSTSFFYAPLTHLVFLLPVTSNRIKYHTLSYLMSSLSRKGNSSSAHHHFVVIYCKRVDFSERCGTISQGHMTEGVKFPVASMRFVVGEGCFTFTAE